MPCGFFIYYYKKDRTLDKVQRHVQKCRGLQSIKILFHRIEEADCGLQTKSMHCIIGEQWEWEGEM